MAKMKEYAEGGIISPENDIEKIEEEIGTVSESPSDLEKYKSLIDKAESMQNAPEKEVDWRSGLGDIAGGLHNILNYAQGSPQQNIKLGGMDAARSAEAAKKKAKLEGVQNLQNMYQKYMAIQEREAAKKDIAANRDSDMKFKRDVQKASLKEKQKDRDLKRELAKKTASAKKTPKTKYQETREKDIAGRFADLEGQLPTNKANIAKSKELIKALEDDRLDTGPGSKLAGDIGSFFSTEESTLKQELDSLAETAARAQLKANGEVRPTDADVEGMKRAMFNMGNTEEANINKLKEFIKQQEASINEYDQMKEVVDSGKGLEDFKLEPTYVTKESEESKGPHGEVVNKNGKTYKWNPSVNKYQLKN